MLNDRAVPLGMLFLTFLAGGLVHIALYGVPFAYGITQLYYCAMVILWAVSVKMRINDKKVRGLMLVIAALLILYFSLQMCAYVLLRNLPQLQNLLWYGYRIPELCIPLAVLRIALSISDGQPRVIGASYRAAVWVGLALAAGMMTNDLHRLAFSSPGGSVDRDHYRRGFLYYLCVAFIVLILAAALYCLIRAIRKTGAAALFRVPLILLSIGLVYFICTDSLLFRVNGVRLWNVGESYAMLILAFLEVCLFTGFIPSNYGYGRIFRKLPLPARVQNGAGETVLASAGELTGSENRRQNAMAIDGGRVLWEIDVANIQRLNRQLEEIADSLNSRNEILQSENSLQQEKAMLDSRNRLYSGISVLVSSQLAQIEALLQDTDSGFDERLARICVLTAYIKRRSNLELLGDGQSTLSVRELYLSIAESLENVKLCGAETAISSFSARSVPSDLILLAYDFFEQVVESCLDSLSAMAVFLAMKEERLELRLLMNAPAFSFDVSSLPQRDGCRQNARITQEDRDTLIEFWAEKGGDAL